MAEASAIASKVCACCGERYPADALFCPHDGSPLERMDRDADAYIGLEISGHIEIRRSIGVGAMGRVYRAFQRGIDRDVAVKILHRELSSNAQLVTRFTREAKVASRLQHPNVVQVLLAGQLADGAMYMVMEYLDGLSLQSVLAASGALPLDRALHIVLQLCEAAGEAHAQGIVHRDLKPDNVMLVRRGSDPDFVKVLDFGIARINWGEQSMATAAGLIFGTARYISPEGAQGHVVGPAGDVYAIATLFFQLLSGRTPFEGDQAVALLVQQIHDPPPYLKSVPRASYVPDPLASVIMSNLAKDPAQRAPDARAFGQAVIRAAKESGLRPEEISGPLRRGPGAMQLPPVHRTNKLDLADDGGANVGARVPTAGTVKWEPPAEFAAKLTPPPSEARGSAPASAPRGVDETLDDADVPPDGASAPRTMPGSIPPSFPSSAPAGAAPSAPAPAPANWGTPAPAQTTERPPRPSLESVVESGERPVIRARSRGVLFVALCFVIGAAMAALALWRMGKLGADVEHDAFVSRATAALFENHFVGPPGENVKDITDEGLRRFHDDPRLLDIRVRAANELVSQAIARHSIHDTDAALRLARNAVELDPRDESARRLVTEYESELATSAAHGSALAPMLEAPATAKPPRPEHLRPSPPTPPTAPAPKATLEVSSATPHPGQPIELSATLVPQEGPFEAAQFAVVGPGAPGGAKVDAAAPSPGLFRGTYAFSAAGKYEIIFTVRANGKDVRTAKSVTVAGAAPSLPPPPPPIPSASASVRWL